MTAPKARGRWVSVLLIILPVWLIGSASVGIWLYLRHEKAKDQIEQARFAQRISTPELADDLRKIVDVIGERNVSSATAAANLTRIAAMIDGLLGPGNTGYAVKREKGPADWPLIHVTLRGKSEETPVWIVTSYDSPAGSKGGESNASGVAATLAAAQAIALEKPENSVHFIFLPHANDHESPVIDSALVLRNLVRQSTPKAVLCVEAMGGGETLWLTSRDTTALALQKIDGLGKVVGAEVACLGEDSDLASVLIELDLPAVRVATRAILTPGEKDDRQPFPPTVAASTGRLVELIQRLAAK
jgi:hypothetical protein